MDDNPESLHQVRIAARRDATVIEIDGRRVDPDALRAYSVSHVFGEDAHVVLHPADWGHTGFEGLARVSVDMPAPGPAAEEFLEAIDAEELERAALARADLGSEPGSLTRAMLAQLGEWARGL
ncbi:hypothetical protein K7472_07970 [Streptomyces sp. PTM05]|uniref:Uncharacterized protein n=1 Tax=Streptantibioticus parmotrematis TaxID=2873249 RepID=A0ABS7QNM4_9ACTN|nr:hypothetical protein [Streptantibioticus parmotrematis]MBY8884781.1 hypothetical protein [Streptantibioticus parmotrematis]